MTQFRTECEWYLGSFHWRINWKRKNHTHIFNKAVHEHTPQKSSADCGLILMNVYYFYLLGKWKSYRKNLHTWEAVTDQNLNPGRWTDLMAQQVWEEARCVCPVFIKFRETHIFCGTVYIVSCIACMYMCRKSVLIEYISMDLKMFHSCSFFLA
jgi:hypothetical protein